MKLRQEELKTILLASGATVVTADAMVAFVYAQRSSAYDEVISMLQFAKLEAREPLQRVDDFTAKLIKAIEKMKGTEL